MLKKVMYAICIQMLAGCLMIYIADKLFAMNGYNVYVGINPITTAFSGIFGVPGVASLFGTFSNIKINYKKCLTVCVVHSIMCNTLAIHVTHV